jgi:hypothetical protein
MTYEKPEVTLLGDSAQLIQANSKDPGDSTGANSDCDLDD